MLCPPRLALAYIAPAVEWARRREAEALLAGEPLTLDAHAWAREAGVRFPELVRTLTVSAVPRPDGRLARANATAGVIADGTEALTMGYGIYLREDVADHLPVLARELFHVGQYERLGGIEGFLPLFLAECNDHGFARAPLVLAAHRHAARSARRSLAT